MATQQEPGTKGETRTGSIVRRGLIAGPSHSQRG